MKRRPGCTASHFSHMGIASLHLNSNRRRAQAASFALPHIALRSGSQTLSRHMSLLDLYGGDSDEEVQPIAAPPEQHTDTDSTAAAAAEKAGTDGEGGVQLVEGSAVSGVPPEAQCAGSGVPPQKPGSGVSPGVPSAGSGVPPQKPSTSSGVPKCEPVVDVASDESDSEDCWAKVRRLTAKKSKSKLDQVFERSYDNQVTKLAAKLLTDASKKARKTHSQDVTPPAKCRRSSREDVTSVPKQPRPAKTDADQPESKADAMQGENLDFDAEKEPPDEEAEPELPKKKRAVRGSANTFAGRRPPRDPARLELFMAKKAAWEQAQKDRKEAKTQGTVSPKWSENQKKFWKHMSDTIKQQGGGKDAFRAAVSQWPGKQAAAAPGQVMCKKRPAAATNASSSSAATAATASSSPAAAAATASSSSAAAPTLSASPSSASAKKGLIVD